MRAEELTGLEWPHELISLDNQQKVETPTKQAKKKAFTHENVNNASVDWYTPAWIFEMLDLRFDLDPCHPEQSISWIPADHRFTLKDDGLSQTWSGTVWLNPPYGKHTTLWLEKMHAHRDGVALLFARTDCRWFHDYVAKADALLFLTGRIRFVDGLGITANGGPGSGSMLVAWGEKAVAALQKNSDKGLFVRLENENYGGL